MEKRHIKIPIISVLFTLLFLVLSPVRNMEIAEAAWSTPTVTQSGTTLTVSWSAYPGSVSQYNIYRTSNTEIKKIATVSSSTLSYADMDPNLNVSTPTLYQYEVAAVVNGTEMFSDSTNIYTKDIIKPNAPSNLKVEANGNGPNYMVISWTASDSTDVSFYQILRNNVVVGITSSTSYRDIVVTANNSFTYKIRAIDINGNSSTDSNSVVSTPTAFGSSIQTVVKLNEDFPTQWTKVSDTNGILSFSSNASWYSTCNKCTRSAEAHLLDSYAFTISPSEAGGNNAIITFKWTKDFGNANNESGRGENIDLYMDFKLKGASTWTTIFTEATSNKNTAGTTETKQLTNVAGDYVIRFRGNITTTDRGSDWGQITVDNLQIKMDVPNTKPAAPTLSVPSLTADNKVNLSWSAITDPDLVGYQIYRNGVLYATTRTNSYVDPNASASQTYTYHVIAVDNGGLSSSSSNTQNLTIPAVTKDLTSPSEPSELKATKITPVAIELSWVSSGSLDVNHYTVWKSMDGGMTFTNVGVTPLTSFKVSGVAPETNYLFRVTAVDDSDNFSAGSNVLNITTPEPDTISPSSPGNFEATQVGETFVKFSWDNSTDNIEVDHYEIQINEAGTWKTKKSVNYPLNTGTVDSLSPDTSYSFRIVAVDSSGNKSVAAVLSSPVKTLIDVTPPNVLLQKPYDTSIGVGTGESIIIRFDDNIKTTTVNDSTLYVVKQGTTAHVPGIYNLNNPMDIRFTPDSLEKEKTYVVTMTTGITNVSDIPIAQTLTWSFTTGISEWTKPHGDYLDNTEMCKNCHNAHSGKRPRLLAQIEIYQVCYTCHDGTGSTFNIQSQFGAFDNPKKSHHPIYKSSSEENVQISCIKCHNPHDRGKNLDTGQGLHWNRLLNSFNKGNLGSGIEPAADNSGNEFCWNCHGKTGSPDFSFGYLDGGKMLSPTDDYRTDHQTFFPSNLTPSNNKGHNSDKMEKFKSDYDTTKGQSISGTGIKCVACHEKHGSDLKPLLRTGIYNKTAPPNPLPAPVTKNGKEFCYQCHENAIEFAYSGYPWNPGGTNNNGETRQNNFDGKTINESRGHAQFDCQVCHNPHGSPYPNYLRLNYRVDTSNTRRFQSNDAALCFDCHDETKLLTTGAKEKDTSGENYHAYHLTSSTKSIYGSCKNCHRPHGAIDSENAGLKDHRIGFPNPEVSGSRSYNRSNNGNGSCSLNCHGRDHSGFQYVGALRSTGNWMLKDNWQQDSILLNSRPDGTGPYKIGEYTIDYRNGKDANGNPTHFRDGDTAGNPTQTPTSQNKNGTSGPATTSNNGFHWK